jgi:hypothetical protein
MSNIVPTVGRVIWYWPGKGDPTPLTLDQPFKADVIYVHGPTAVNLEVISHEGRRFTKQSVLITDGAEPGFAQWMPYQKGQAARTEQAEAAAMEAGALERTPR